jgi:ABC-type glycerol-3-phosphate transport system substrate-binding protein
MKRANISRRRFVSTTAAASATVIAAPFVHNAHAAGKLSIGLWDHWVPSANAASKALIEEWAAKEKVDVQIDYITWQGEKLLMTAAMESQSKSGHDILTLRTWWAHEYAKNLAPVDDIVEPLIKQNGAVNETVKYLGYADGHWLAVPATPGSNIKGPCSRIDLLKQHAGIDVQALYPAGQPPKAENWTLDAFLKAAEACHKAGFPFGIGLGTTTDSVDTIGAIFQSFGATLVDANEKITVKSDAVREALDYYTRLARFFPPDAPAWDDATNNKWLVAGKGALIMNPPSAWAVAKRDAPQVAEQLWTHGMPSAKGLCSPSHLTSGASGASAEQIRGQSLLVHFATGGHQAGGGQPGLRPAALRQHDDQKVWAEEARPRARSTTTPIPTIHQILSIAAAPSPQDRAANLCPGPHDQDDRSSYAGRAHGKTPGVGGDPGSASCAARAATAIRPRSPCPASGAGYPRSSAAGRLSAGLPACRLMARTISPSASMKPPKRCGREH